jgi:hypothetical protein
MMRARMVRSVVVGIHMMGSEGVRKISLFLSQRKVLICFCLCVGPWCCTGTSMWAWNIVVYVITGKIGFGFFRTVVSCSVTP